MTKVLRTSLLGLGFLVSCGGSASRGHHDAQPPGVTGGADSEGDSGKGGTVGGGSVATAGRGGTSGAGASGGGTPAQLGGMNGVGGDGMGGDGAAPTLSLPAGCEPRAHTETATACSLALYCDTASDLTSC